MHNIYGGVKSYEHNEMSSCMVSELEFSSSTNCSSSNMRVEHFV